MKHDSGCSNSLVGVTMKHDRGYSHTLAGAAKEKEKDSFT